MSETKKSFTAQLEWLDTLEELTDQEAGALAKGVFRCAAGKDPGITDKMLKMCFIPIRNKIKEDLDKRASAQLQRMEAARKSANVRRLKSTVVNEIEQSKENLNEGQVSLLDVIDEVHLEGVKEEMERPKRNFSMAIQKRIDKKQSGE